MKAQASGAAVCALAVIVCRSCRICSTCGGDFDRAMLLADLLGFVSALNAIGPEAA